jgi:hypothetical protein
MKSDDHTMPSAALSAATSTTHGTHITFNGLSIQQVNNYNELTSVSQGIYSSKMYQHTSHSTVCILLPQKLSAAI